MTNEEFDKKINKLRQEFLERLVQDGQMALAKKAAKFTDREFCALLYVAMTVEDRANAQ